MTRAKTCPRGHTFQKTSDCPTCPICEAAKKAKTGFLAALSAPAQRALKGAGLTTLQKLAGRTEREVLALHGVGPSALPPLRAALKSAGLSFRADSTPKDAPRAKRAKRVPAANAKRAKRVPAAKAKRAKRVPAAKAR